MQLVIEKLLNMKENSLRNNYYNTDGNKVNLKSNHLYESDTISLTHVTDL